LSKKKSLLITLGVAVATYLVIWIFRLNTFAWWWLPREEWPKVPGAFPSMPAHVFWLLFIPFIVVVVLFLLNTALSKFPKIVSTFGVFGIYGGVIMGLISKMTAMAAIVYSLFVPLYSFLDTRWFIAGRLPFYGAIGHREAIAAFISIGFAITTVGLAQIIKAQRKNSLATEGLYAITRHPQVLGISIWAFGFALWGTTPVDFVSSFTLVYGFILLSLYEERKLEQKFGSEYMVYKQRVSFIIPFVPPRAILPSATWKKVVTHITIYLLSIVIIIGVFKLMGEKIVISGLA